MTVKLNNSSLFDTLSPRGGTADATDLKSERYKLYGDDTGQRNSSSPEAAGSAPGSTSAAVLPVVTPSLPANRRNFKRSETAVECPSCGLPFHPLLRQIAKGQGRFCSKSCYLIHRYPGLKFVTPESDKAERIRANGIINRRRRLGWFKPPAACMKCGVTVKRLDAHHHDYTKVDEVVWVCRSCHIKSHFRPGYFDGIAPMKMDARADGKPKGFGSAHGRGGRKGPTGKAKGRMPLVGIRSITVTDGQVVEHLACGHTFTRPADGKRRAQQRCPECPRVHPPSVPMWEEVANV